MMLAPDRKKAVTVIVAGLGDSDDGPTESDHDYALKACATKVMECVERKDCEGFCEYMKDFIEMCSDKKPEMEMDY